MYPGVTTEHNYQSSINYNISDKDERGRSLSGPSKYIAIENIDCSKSICSADVVLISSLSEGKTYKWDYFRLGVCLKFKLF